MQSNQEKNKTAILYKSVLGTSEQYAKWLAQAIDGDLYQFSNAKPETLTKYEKIVISSGTYLRGWMPLVKFLENNWSILEKKDVVIMAVGLKSPDSPDSIKSFLRIPQQIRDKVKYFKLPGRIMSLNAENVKKSNLSPVEEYLTA